MNVVIGAEVFLCMTETVFGAGQSLGVKNVVTTIEREVVLGRYSSNIPLECAMHPEY